MNSLTIISFFLLIFFEISAYAIDESAHLPNNTTRINSRINNRTVPFVPEGYTSCAEVQPNQFEEPINSGMFVRYSFAYADRDNHPTSNHSEDCKLFKITVKPNGKIESTIVSRCNGNALPIVKGSQLEGLKLSENDGTPPVFEPEANYYIPSQKNMYPFLGPCTINDASSSCETTLFENNEKEAVSEPTNSLKASETQNIKPRRSKKQ